MTAEEKKIDRVIQNEILAKLSAEIEAHRKHQPKQERLPKKLRDIVLGLMNQGLSSNELGLAIGVTGRAIRYWQKAETTTTNKTQASKPKILTRSVKRQRSKKNKFKKRVQPRELLVEVERGVAVSPLSETVASKSVTVSLRSGVRIELEMSALSSDFLLRLNQIGVG